MSEEEAKLSGPDLTQGVELSTVPDGTMLPGHVRGEPALLVRRGDELFAIGATCTHYGGPLEQGLLVGDTIRCPWHHACFSVRTGEALRAPALDPVSRWRSEVRDWRVSSRRSSSGTAPVCSGKARSRRPALAAPGGEAIIIVGGGAAGNAAAETLRGRATQAASRC